MIIKKLWKNQTNYFYFFIFRVLIFWLHWSKSTASVSILKQLSYLLHYCLLNYHSSLSLTSITNELGINAFNLNTITESQFKLYKQFQTENDLNQTLARDCLINILPSILSSMTQVWQRCNLLLNSNGFTILWVVYCAWRETKEIEGNSRA